MATKKLSEPMKKALLSADADGWIEKYNAPTHTSVALMDRGLVTAVKHRRHHDSDYPDALGSPGHWLTDAGKAKVAELRADVARKDPNAVRCANPACGEPVEIRMKSKSGYGHINPTLDGTHLAQPAMPQPEAQEIRAGDLIEIRQPGKRKWAMRVEQSSADGWWRGVQIRMTDGTPGRTRFVGGLKPGEYTIVERARPAAKAGHSSRCRAAIYAGTRFAKDWPRDPERCDGDACKADTVDWNGRTFGELTPAEKKIATKQAAEQLQRELERVAPEIGKVLAAEQPRKTVTTPVKLTEAQIDGLHFFGAPLVVQQRWHYHQPHGRTVKALRARLLLKTDSRDLSVDGRNAYMEYQPTGRLPQEFADAWAGTKALTSEPAPTVEPDGPACLTDGEADELGTKTRAAIAGMLGDVELERLPSLDELMIRIELVRDVSAESHRPHVEGIRNVLRVLYREAGR